MQAEADKPCAESKGSGPILATLRSPLTDTVRFCGNTRLLQTKADYCVISDWDRRYLSTKLVVVAAGVEGRVAGLCRCLSSMGLLPALAFCFWFLALGESRGLEGERIGLTKIAIIHRMRREENRDPVVYGCYSDGFEFTFYRIDHKSRVRLILDLLSSAKPPFCSATDCLQVSSSTLRRNEHDAWIYARLRLISRNSVHEYKAS